MLNYVLKISDKQNSCDRALIGQNWTKGRAHKFLKINMLATSVVLFHFTSNDNNSKTIFYDLVCIW